jgi:hypothetical protein
MAHVNDALIYVYHFVNINLMNTKRKWSENDLRKAVITSTSTRQVICKLGLKPAGGNYLQIHKYITYYHIDTKHFKGKAWNKGLRGIGKPFLPLKNILHRNSDFQSYKLKNRLFDEHLKPRHCELCGWAKTSSDGRLPVELDHINGDHRDNRLINLRILCPNCHSLQSTHRGRNRGIIR